VVVACGAFLFQSQLVEYTGVADAVILLILLFTITSNYTSFNSFLASTGQLSTQNWINTVQSITVLVGQLLLVALGLGVSGMAYGLALGEIILIPLIHYYLRTVPRFPTRETLQSVWEFARYSVPSSFLGKAYARLDVLLLGFLTVPAAAGYYEVAYKLTIPAIFITNIASHGLIAKISDLHSQQKDVNADISNTLAFTSVIAVPLFFGALAIAEPIIVTVYSQSYSAAAPLLVGLSLYRVIQTQSDVLMSTIQGLDKPKKEMYTSAVALATNIPLGIVLFIKLGPFGVVVATIIAESVRYLLLKRIASAQIDATLLPRPLAAQIGSGVVMFVIVTTMRQFVTVRSWVDLIPFLTVGAVVYSSILMVTSKYIRKTTVQILRELLRPTEPS
jgi:O-antigen/teichoic acid export membrane protein